MRVVFLLCHSTKTRVLKMCRRLAAIILIVQLFQLSTQAPVTVQLKVPGFAPVSLKTTRSVNDPYFLRVVEAVKDELLHAQIPAEEPNRHVYNKNLNYQYPPAWPQVNNEQVAVFRTHPWEVYHQDAIINMDRLLPQPYNTPIINYHHPILVNRKKNQVIADNNENYRVILPKGTHLKVNANGHVLEQSFEDNSKQPANSFAVERQHGSILAPKTVSSIQGNSIVRKGHATTKTEEDAQSNENQSKEQ